MPRLIRFRDLEPTWTTKQAREAGFMRWLATWVGGPPGHINTNPGVAVESDRIAIGMMYLPRGQRQAGVHTHSVTEIYVILQGELEGLDASGHPHRAGPLDCTYTPPGCPHGVRNCGMQDVVLIWIHDGIERNGTAVYYPDSHHFGDVPSMAVVPFAGLDADWSGPGARTPGTMHWSTRWVQAGGGTLTGGAIRNDRISIGMTVLDPGHSLPADPLPMTRHYLVIGGTAITPYQDRNEVLTWLDGLYVPSGETVVFRNNGPEPLRLLWVEDAPRA